MVNKVFRIERAIYDGSNIESLDIEAIRHQDVMEAIAELQENFGTDKSKENSSQEKNSDSNEILECIRTELEQINLVKSEMDGIRNSILQTKREISSMRHSGFSGEEQASPSNELDAVIKGTEEATDKILTAAEIIESNAANLVNALNREGDHNMALDIQEQAIAIFEACNFQDLTGQRVTKVVSTLKFIEERIDHMIDIWGGKESFAGIIPEQQKRKTSYSHLLNGPALEGAIDISSQDDIDAIFE